MPECRSLDQIPRFSSVWRIGYALTERFLWGRIVNVIGGRGKEEMDMGSLSAVTKKKITEILDATYFTQHGFTVKYDDENNPMVTITFSDRPEYQFVIDSTDNGNVFTTSECPGTHLDAAETFQRTNFELCIDAIKEWTERIIDRQKDWMMDEFGGVADRSPNYKE
jgi:hypothetical protein